MDWRLLPNGSAQCVKTDITPLDHYSDITFLDMCAEYVLYIYTSKRDAFIMHAIKIMFRIKLETKVGWKLHLLLNEPRNKYVHQLLQVSGPVVPEHCININIIEFFFSISSPWFLDRESRVRVKNKTKTAWTNFRKVLWRRLCSLLIQTVCSLSNALR